MQHHRARSFLCGHCGLRHATIAEIKGCAVDHPIDEQAAVSTIALDPDWAALAGPASLGRSLVVEPNAAIPGPWADAEHVVVPAAGAVESADMDRVLNELQQAYTQRHRLVIESGGPIAGPVERRDIGLSDLDPTVELTGDRLDHLMFANSVDARDPSAPSIRMVDRAVAAGAAVVRQADRGDIVSPDGTSLWCDGGPLEAFTVDRTEGVAVVPRVHLMSGILRSLTHRVPEAELAADQLAAVDARRGAARIVAPAGAGKTRVLTERARHLIRGLGVDASTVCLVAFNVRARHEMQERTADLPGLQIRTLNSLALAICRGTGSFLRPTGGDITVIDEHRVRDHLRDLVVPPRRAMTDPFAAWIEAFTACRLGLRDPHLVESEFDGDVPGLPEIIAAYRTRLTELGEVDFDEQIIAAIQVLLTQPECRVRARVACGMLLVDEFQDLTPAHLLLIRLLAGPAAEVFGVGDDDQTIYGYSGASPSWLIDFAKWFPGAAHHDLHVNYRCAPEVIEAATNLLSHNRRRIPKRVASRPNRYATPTDADHARHPMRRIVADDEVGELCDTVDAMLAAGVQPGRIAVLTRVNATLLAPMLALRAGGVPTTTPVDSGYLSRTGVAAALAWLRLATCPETRLRASDLEIAARRPPRAISPMVAGWLAEQGSVGDIERLAARLRSDRDQHKIRMFAEDLGSLHKLVLRGADTASVLNTVRNTLGLGSALETRLDASRRSLDRSSHGDDLEALVSVAYLQPDPAEFPEWLSTQLVGPRDFKSSGVRLSTIHRVKGMQWPRVIVYGADEGVCPHRLSSDVEEERRIFHVAITRSSEQTVVIAGRSPSPFLAELDHEAPPAPPEPFESPIPVRPPRPRRSPTRASNTVAADPAVLRGEAGTLFEALRSWRTRISREAGVPAYVVFDNRTLQAIASRRPADKTELLAVRGVGPAKLDRYGDDVLEITGDS